MVGEDNSRDHDASLRSNVTHFVSFTVGVAAVMASVLEKGVLDATSYCRASTNRLQILS